jgi:hypothetical protein
LVECFQSGEKGWFRVFEIADLPLGAGRIGICPLPGRYDDFGRDMAAVVAWRPTMVLTMTTEIEMEAAGAEGLPAALTEAGIAWRHLPVSDFRAPCASVAAHWPGVSADARQVLAAGGRVLVHCYGGCGRSGMALVRLMVEAGEAPDAALARLRAVRPCAVETAAQFGWAGSGALHPEQMQDVETAV